MDKYYTKQLTLALTIIMTLSWIGIYYYFFKHLNTHHIYFNGFVFLLPIVSLWIHYFYIIEKIDHALSDDEFMWYIDQEIRSEQAFVDILPVTIFGTGILLTNYITNLNTVMRDFYLLIVFGLIIPLLVSSLTYTIDDIYKKLINDIITFGSESYAFSLFFIIFNKLFTQNYDIYKQYMVVFKDSNKKPNIHLKKYAELNK